MGPHAMTTSMVILLTTTGYLLLSNIVLGQQMDDEITLLQALNDTRFDTIFNSDNLAFDEHYENSKCQQMNIKFCEEVDYNKTMMPNFLGGTSQTEVSFEISQFHPLIRVSCSPDTKLYLCSMYAPICFDKVVDGRPMSLLPCRSLCESVREGCSGYISAALKYDIGTLPAFQCEKLPDGNNGKQPCVGREEDQRINSDSNERSESTQHITRDLGFVCPKNFEVPNYSLQFNGKTYNNCAMPCEDVYLDRHNSQIVRYTSALLAMICVLSTLFVCLTFLIDTKRFKYPARPIIIISLCQFIVATCYIVGFATSNKISCNDPIDPPKSLPNMKMIRTTTMGNRKGICTLQFMALYFFQVSSMFWWLMMTISWYMIARLKWAPEAVSGVARYFHLVSWAVPALLTVYLSVLGNIEGDSLTGTCYVSTSNQESIRLFVIYPALFCLIVGSIFLSLGFKSIYESWETLRREYGKQTDEHYKLVIRIGLYSVLFILSTSTLIYCHHFEQNNHNSWMLSWLSNICKVRDYSIPCPIRNVSHKAPHYWPFIIKYTATMATGIISAIFMISKKTISAYREVGELCNYNDNGAQSAHFIDGHPIDRRHLNGKA